MARILIAGCGYVGMRLGELLVEDSHSVWGLRRKPRSLPSGIRPIEADLCDPASLVGLPEALDCVFYLASPRGSEDALYRRAYVDGLRGVLDALADQGQRMPRVLFASSTAVYAQREGEWVDESSATEPQHWGGRRLLEAEAIVRAAPSPGVVVRFGGIYGPRRTRLIDSVRTGRAGYRADPAQYTNRIHRDDCAGALYHLMGLEDPDPIYLGVDRDPCDERTVLCWLAGALGAPEPREESSAAAASSRANKRCQNDRLLRSGYTFRYPTFREGYRAVLEGLV